MSPSIPPRCWSESARRHFDDAEYLRLADPPRLANADHHYGIAAECVVKTFLAVANQRQGNPFKDPEHGHVNEKALWTELQLMRNDRKLHPYLCKLTGSPFQDWHVVQRYLCNDSQSFALTRVDAHRSAAARCLAALEDAILAGVVP